MNILQEIRDLCINAQGKWLDASIENCPIEIKTFKLIVELIEKQFSKKDSKIIIYKDLIINEESFEVFVNKKPIKLKKKQFLLLCFLLKNPNKIFTREQILNNVWPVDANVIDRTVDVHINLIKKQISFIEIVSISGMGYKLIKK